MHHTNPIILYKPFLSATIIEEFPCDTCAVEGEGVFFKVVVRGYPQPSLTWYHNDTLLMADYSIETQQDGSLSITSSELKHSGVYRLSARNSTGSAEREVRLTVTKEEEEPAVTVKERVEIQPVPMAKFGEFVAGNHAQSDKIFRLQFNVSEMVFWLQCFIVCL